MWRSGPIGWGAFQSGDLTVRPLLPTGADTEGDVHSAPPLLLGPITWVTHHQTPRHTPAFYCWPFLAQPGCHHPQDHPGPEASITGRWVPSRASEEWQGTGSRLQTAAPTLVAHTREQVLCPPQGRPRPQLGTAPLAKKVPCSQGPGGFWKKLSSPLIGREKAWFP